MDFGVLSQMLCALSGRSPFVAFLAGAAAVVFLVMMLIGEDKGHMSWGIKIAFAVAGLLSLGPLLIKLFGLNLGCTVVY